MNDATSVAVVGAGAWGTTIARMVAQSGIPTVLVTHTAEQAQALRSTRENRVYLPGFTIPRSVHITPLADDAVGAADVVFVVVPTARMREVATQLGALISPRAIVVSCAKGFEIGSNLRMSEVFAEASGIESERICALSGPNLAREIAAGMPASTAVAGANHDAAVFVQRLLTSPTLRVYTSMDVVGVEYGGALKNVVAIAAGAVDGLRLGQNAKAALMTRGLVEIARIGVAAGGDWRTFAGLSGLGDLIATCESPLSRNRTFGERLGSGMPADEAAGGTPHVVEGIYASRAAVNLASDLGVEAPISHAVVDVLDGRASVRDAMARLMTRAARPEPDELRLG